MRTKTIACIDRGICWWMVAICGCLLSGVNFVPLDVKGCICHFAKWQIIRHHTLAAAQKPVQTVVISGLYPSSLLGILSQFECSCSHICPHLIRSFNIYIWLKVLQVFYLLKHTRIIKYIMLTVKSSLFQTQSPEFL